jgi:hypothetical protein
MRFRAGRRIFYAVLQGIKNKKINFYRHNYAYVDNQIFNYLTSLNIGNTSLSREKIGNLILYLNTIKLVN